MWSNVCLELDEDGKKKASKWFHEADMIKDAPGYCMLVGSAVCVCVCGCECECVCECVCECECLL